MASAVFLKVAPGVDAPEDAMQRSRDAWAELLMLPKCVLAVATRSRKKHKHALLPKGMADTSIRTLRALERKHPQETEERDLIVPQGVSGPQEDFLDMDILAALGTFPKCSASRLSGLKAQHFLDAVASPDQASGLDALTHLVNLLARGPAAQHLSQHVAVASLTALPKDDGDIRPIAVGEVFRRLTNNILCADVTAEARRLFWPLQVGVASPLGTETVVHTFQQYVSRHQNSPDKAVLLIDFRNAFNSVQRFVFLDEVGRHMPCLEAWARWCYGGPSDPLFGSRVLMSNRGVQQDDALGPLLFSLAVHPLLQELKSYAGLDIVCGYLDDFCVAGEFGATLRALRLTQRKAASLGLELDLDKCEAIPAAGRNAECSLSEFPAVVQRKVDGCFKLLDTPVGCQEHCAEYVEVKRARKLTAMLDEVPLLEDAQVAHKLLSRCFGAARLVHSMRTTRPDWITRGLERSQQALRSTFQICTGTALNESQRQQASLPLSKGGLGFRFGNSHAAAAYLASRVAARHLCGQIGAAFSWGGDCDGGAQAAAVNLCNVGARQEHRITSEDLGADGAFPGQRALSMKMDERLLGQLIAAGPDARKARLLATSAPRASAWLRA
ncbi:unnamed protein product [Prorocentrum cordatum]|uniref:Reverse transcriptase domain-containing protein n=1 Tax=Prorocentrum cordatum TaxID=2364126 RepID=A0ABN9WI37_9DINO|nr:unnamed protein product [Polarella glacialis]